MKTKSLYDHDQVLFAVHLFVVLVAKDLTFLNLMNSYNTKIPKFVIA